MRRCYKLTAQSAAVAMTAELKPEGQQQNFFPPEQPIYLKPSRSRRRKASFLFTRMREGPPANAIKAPPLGTAMPLFCITSSSCEYYALRLPLVKAGFRRLSSQANLAIPSNLLWGRSMFLHPVTSIAQSSSLSSSLPLSSCSSVTHGFGGGGGDADLIALQTPSAAAGERVEILRPAKMVCNHQRFNHFPRSHSNVGCKWGLTKRLRHMANKLKEAGDKQNCYGFVPRTWLYPDEKEDVMKALIEARPKQRFIWKPARGSCGHGILTCMGGARNAQHWERLIAEIDCRTLVESPVTGGGMRKYVVQEYIDDPLLLDGRKTDLRLYVAVTSYDPLTVYLHEEGLVRLAAHEYNAGDRVGVCQFNPFRDLTNYSVGKRLQMRNKHCRGREVDDGVSSNFEQSPLAPQPELKKSLKELWEYIDQTYPLSSNGIATATPATSTFPRRMSEKVKEEIGGVVVKTLLAVKASLESAANNILFPGGFFELYGFDLMLDTKLKPWLVEVNTLPSLASTSSLDYAVKTNVVADLLNLAMIEPFERPDACFDELSRIVHLDNVFKPLTKEAAELVHRWKGDESTSFGVHLSDSEAKEEVSFRLQDELMYCGGFQRIFPPLSSFQTPLMLNEFGAVSRHVPFSKADIWALEA